MLPFLQVALLVTMARTVLVSACVAMLLNVMEPQESALVYQVILGQLVTPLAQMVTMATTVLCPVGASKREPIPVVMCLVRAYVHKTGKDLCVTRVSA